MSFIDISDQNILGTNHFLQPFYKNIKKKIPKYMLESFLREQQFPLYYAVAKIEFDFLQAFHFLICLDYCFSNEPPTNRFANHLFFIEICKNICSKVRSITKR